jgi:charged multivesicular body protein 2B
MFQKLDLKINFKFKVNDTLDGVLEGSDDEAESDAIVNKVLDEIGIEITGKLADAKAPMRGSLATNKVKDDDVTDSEIQDMLNRLKAS